MTRTHTLIDDFDGDGFVARAVLVTACRGASPALVRLEIDCGSHRSTLDLNAADLANLRTLLTDASMEMDVALTAAPEISDAAR